MDKSSRCYKLCSKCSEICSKNKNHKGSCRCFSHSLGDSDIDDLLTGMDEIKIAESKQLSNSYNNYIEEQKEKAKAIFEEAFNEMITATAKHGEYCSLHEAYAVILEELDELWDEIKKQKRDENRIKEEAIQVTAGMIKLLLSYKRML